MTLEFSDGMIIDTAGGRVEQDRTPPLFAVGQVVMTAGVAAMLRDVDGPEEEADAIRARRADEVLECVARHLSGDFGTVCAADRAANRRAISDGERILSAYTVAGARIWIITEADRSSTCILLPEEY